MAAIRTHPPRSWGEVFSPAVCVRIGVVAVLLVVVYWGTIQRTMVSRWIRDGNWSHGWLIPLFSLYFLLSQGDALRRCRPRTSWWGALVLGVSLTMFFVSGWQWRMGYPQALSILGAISGVTLLLGGGSVMRVAWFPIAYLIFAIPWPQFIYVDATMPLRILASQIAAAVMPLFATGLWTEAQAVVIDYKFPGQEAGSLNVAEACSGMRLMMAFVALGVALAYLRERPLWQRIVMVLSCVPVAVACNAIRVTVTGLLYVHGMDDWATGWPHKLLGLLMLVIALGFYELIGTIFSHLFVEDVGKDADATHGDGGSQILRGARPS